MVLNKSSILNNFHYYTYGKIPRLLVHSGTHGDEYEIIDIVADALERYKADLPSFIFVPRVSPSAVELRTRENTNGYDLNRQFKTDSTELEVLENLKIVERGPFDLFVTFHEDPLCTAYYMYDVGSDELDRTYVVENNATLQKHGIELYSGVDDPLDENLNHEFVNGYKKFAHNAIVEEDGMISTWALNKKLAKDCWIPEVPGRASIETKKFLVDNIFKNLILEYFKRNNHE